MGHVTVRIHGKAKNLLYCRPAPWNTVTHILIRKHGSQLDSRRTGIIVLPHRAPRPSYSWHLCPLSSDTSLLWPHLEKHNKTSCVTCARLRGSSVHCGPAFASAALDEEADEVEERSVSVCQIRLNPVINHHLHQQRVRFFNKYHSSRLKRSQNQTPSPCFRCMIRSWRRSSYLDGSPAQGHHLEQGDSLHVFLFDTSALCSANAAAAGRGSLTLVILEHAARSSPPLLQEARNVKHNEHENCLLSWQGCSLSKWLVLFEEEKTSPWHTNPKESLHIVTTAETYSLLPVFTPGVVLWMTDSCRAGSLCVTPGSETPQQQKEMTWMQEACEGTCMLWSPDRVHPLIMSLTFVLRTWMKQQLKALVSCPPQIFTQDSSVSLQTRHEQKIWMFNQTALPFKMIFCCVPLEWTFDWKNPD